MAMLYAADLYNELPRNSGSFCPEEIFAQAQITHSRLLNARA
jgi:hypothetical protein